MNLTRLLVSESVTLCDGSVRGWLAGDTDGLAADGWVWSKWACTGAAWRLALHRGRGRRAGTAQKITAAWTGGFNWGHSSTNNKHHILHMVVRLASI